MQQFDPVQFLLAFLLFLLQFFLGSSNNLFNIFRF